MKTHRIGILAVAIAGALGFASHTLAQGNSGATRTLSIATLAPPGSTWMRVFESWNREVRRRSNRTLDLRFYPGGVQGDEAEVIRKIRNGRLDGAAVTAVGLSQVYRPALVFQMPGILNSYEQLDEARTALAAEMDAGFDAAGFKMFGWADVGRSRIFSTGPVRTPADLARRRPWVWRDDLVMPAWFQVARANPVALQVPEVLGALQTNRIDSLVVTPVASVALQWSSRVSHMTDFPVAFTIGGSVMGKRQWDSLSAEHRAILAETGTQFHALARRNLRRDEETALRTLAARRITIIELDAPQRAEWERVATQSRAQLAGQVADQALIDRVLAFGRR